MSIKNKQKETLKQDTFRQGNLIRLLKTFTKSDLREFEKFVLSPYHNNRSDVTRFFYEIKKYYPDFERKDFSKQVIFTKLYPKTEYKDDVLRRLQSNLFKLGESYIAHRTFAASKFEFDIHVLNYYYEKFIDNLYSKQRKSITDFVEGQKNRSSEYYQRIYRIEEMNRSFTIKSDPTLKNQNIQKEMDSLMTYTLINLLRVNSLAVSGINQFNKKYNLKYLDPLLNIAEQSGFMDSKAVEIYWLAIKLDTASRENETFYRLKAMLEKHSEVLEPDEKIRIYNCLLSYCFDKKVIPGKDLDKEEFELISQMLDSGLLVVDNTIYSEWFMYAFLSAVRVGEISYAEKMIEKYGKMLPDDERSNILNHAGAELALVKRDYQTALKLLSLPKYNSLNEKLRANHMYIKIYYETGNNDQFFYQVSSFNQLMRNVTSLSKETGIIPRTNFIKFTTKLFKLRLNEIDTPIDELKREIMNSKILGNKWLLEKVDEIKLSLRKRKRH